MWPLDTLPYAGVTCESSEAPLWMGFRLLPERAIGTCFPKPGADVLT